MRTQVEGEVGEEGYMSWSGEKEKQERTQNHKTSPTA